LKISTKTRYGLRAVLRIARSKESQVNSEIIAEREGISKKYLDAILGQLRRAGILKSNRGVFGGYALAKSAEEITVLEICEALEVATFLSPCVGDSEYCTHSCICNGNKVWTEATNAMRAVLAKSTIASMIPEANNGLSE
jgi:Rrf2 family protein